VPTLRDWQIQFFQVGTVPLLGPLVVGAIARAEAIVQMRHGPRLLRPYYDIAKLFRKETVLPREADVIFRAAPYVSFAAYATVQLLIPVLTTFPLPSGYGLTRQLVADCSVPILIVQDGDDD
jgi:formate hydrogenlyase subunit 4